MEAVSSASEPSLSTVSRKGGHLFIINGDLTKVACDALLVPTDRVMKIEPAWESLFEGRRHEIPKSWNSKLAVSLPARDKEPRVWLGNIGQVGDASDFSAFEPIVRQFVVDACAQLKDVPDDDRIYAWPKRRLAVNVAGSGLGGGSAKKGHLVFGLVGTLTDLAKENDVDIILVTYGPKPYAAAQRARRKYIGGNEADSWAFCTEANGNLIPEAHRLANEAIERHLVLFIGAGVSAGAGLPTWKELLDDFAEDAGFDAATRNALAARDPRDQATLIERELEHEAQPLKSRVAARLEKFDRFSLLHGLLASLPSQEAVTTNYDMLFETAYESRERRVAVLPQNPRGTDGHWLLKLHGSVDTPDKMILTRSDYLSMPRQYGALMGLVQGLLLMRRMVFVGYSLSDEDFHELIDEVRAARGGTDDGVGKGIALTLSEDPLSRKLWEQDLDIVPMVTGPDVDLNIAGRELELFLNLVGFLSTTSAGFFLDDSYSDLSEDERELREKLQLLAEATAGSDLDTVGHLVEEFLKGLGAADDG